MNILNIQHFKKYVSLGLCLAYWSVPLSSQNSIMYTQSFTSLLKMHDLQFDRPEPWFKVTPLTGDAHLEYDLVLYSEVEDMEIRYVYIPVITDRAYAYPDFAFTQVLSDIASNADRDLIYVRQLAGQEVQKELSADWAAIATFTPKLEFSDKKRAKMISAFHAKRGRLFAIFLYNGSSSTAEPYLYNLRFKEEKNSG